MKEYLKGKDIKQCGSCLTYHYIQLALSTCIVCSSHKDIIGIKPKEFENVELVRNNIENQI